MKKEEFWAKVVERYPEFSDDEHILKQTSRGLRKLIFQAWEKGHEHGLKNGKALADKCRTGQQASGRDAMDVFNELFGDYGKS